MVRAVTFQSPGPPSVLQVTQVDIGAPSANEVLLRQTAIGVNYSDILIRKGKKKAVSPILGHVACGVIEQIGEKVAGFSIGDRVAYATAHAGAYCEHRCINQEYIFPCPGGMRDEVIASILFPALTAHYLLFRTFIIRPASLIMVNGVISDTSNVIVQWANATGATVIGIVNSAEQADQAKKSGCKYVFNRNEQDLVKEILNITDNVGVNIVYDFVGSDTINSSIDSLMRIGVLVLCDQAINTVQSINVIDIAAKSLFISVPSIFDYKENRMELILSVNEVFDALLSNKIKMPAITTYKLEDAANAHEHVESGEYGSVILLL